MIGFRYVGKEVMLRKSVSSDVRLIKLSAVHFPA